MRRTPPLVAALAVLGGLLSCATAAEAEAAPITPGTDRTVTLLTGDRVRATPEGLLVEAGAGRKGVAFNQYEVDGHRYVVPVDALAMVGDGRLDRRLFDISALLAMGYDDARADLPLIVTGAGGRWAAGTRTANALPSIDGAAVRLSTADRARFWSTFRAQRTAGRTVWLDGVRQVSLEHSVPQVGAPTAWQAGYTGRGVTVAVLDSGVDTDHPDLAGRVAESRDFTAEQDGVDRVGHGTHVASILAGSGAAAEGRIRGVAPESTVLSGKVCTLEGCPESAILAGMEWAATNGATVVNLSLGGPDGPELDPVEQAVNSLTERHGTLFVVAAGNSGHAGPYTVDSPGSADAALTVGAVDRRDALADFSGRGPRNGDDAIKPDLTAPGTDIVAARAVGTPAGDETPVDEAYTRLSGTSMATPHVAGAAAVLAQRHPDWRAGALKTALTGTAVPAADLTPFEQGSGRLDVARAVTQTVRAEPANLSLGRPRWPHTDDEPITRTVTYRNDGAAAVTLSPAVDVSDPAGRAAPAGMFSVLPTEVTVPPGSTGTVTVTVDTRVPAPDGLYSGAVVASAESQRLRTPLVVNREPESYDLTLTHLDRTGAPTPFYGTSVNGVDLSFSAAPYDGDGTVTVRVPRGRYNVDSVVAEGDLATSSKLVHPLVELHGDTTVALDARAARPVEVTVPHPNATPLLTAVGYYRRLADGELSSSLFTVDGAPVLSAQFGPTLPADQLTGRVLSWWGEPDGSGRFGAGSHLYNLAWFPPGRMPTGFTRRVRPAELAVVRADYRTRFPGATFERAVRPVAPGWEGFLGVVTTGSLPATRTEYYTADGVDWSAQFSEVVGDEYRAGQLARTTYRPGRRTESWGAAPFGPSLREVDGSPPWVHRQGDLVSATVPLFGDGQDGHVGWSVVESAHAALYREGVRVPELDGRGRYEVPPGSAEFRLEARATRAAAFELSISVDCVWTFKSGTVSADRPVALPITAIHLNPALDGNDAAPAGRPFRIPIQVRRQPGAPATTTTTLTAEVSYDDGRTWHPAPTTGVGDRRVATVTHPDTAEFVSVRVESADNAGNTTQQTIIRAYRLRD